MVKGECLGFVFVFVCMVGEIKVNNNGWVIFVGLSYIEVNNFGLCGLFSNVVSGLLKLIVFIECFDVKVIVYFWCVV